MDLLPEERRVEILDQVRRRPMVRAADLARDFGVSIETIRRDFVDLERAGQARRVYGGIARAGARAEEPSFEERVAAGLERKRAMARLAASLVEPGEQLTLDIGTSVAELAAALPASFRGRVLTTSLRVAGELAGRDGVELLIAGGRVRAGDLAVYGAQAEAFFREFYGGTAFLGSGGVHLDAGLTDFHVEEVAARRVVLERADRRYVLAESRKLGFVAPVRVCGLDAITAVITDDGVDEATVHAFADAGVTLLVAEP